MKTNKPILIITGASGNIGTSLCTALKKNYRMIGLDIKLSKAARSIKK